MSSSHCEVRFPAIANNGRQNLTSTPLTTTEANTSDCFTDSSSTSTNSSSMTRIIREWHNSRTELGAADREMNQSSNYQTPATYEDYIKTNPIAKSTKPYNEVAASLAKRMHQGRYTDFITRERLRHPTVKQVAFNDYYKLDMESLQHELRDTLDPELHETDLGPFAQEIDDELRRMDFEEFIVLQSMAPSEMGHLYFKIVKLFRYINITNVQGTLISLLSLVRLIKRSPEVVQAVEESDGVVLLLNLLECKIVPVQLAAMRLLAALFQVMYLRRMAIAYGAIQVLVDLLLESDDDIKVMTSDLLASLALLKEARQLIPKTKGIQHLVCLLNMTSLRTALPPARDRPIRSPSPGRRPNRRHSLINEEELRAREDMLRGERVLISVATALWRFSRSTINRKIMQRAGLVLTLVRLVRMKNEKILVPVLGILQGCATDAAFRLSIRTEGILKYIIRHMRCVDPRVKLQCVRTLYYCTDDEKTKELVHNLGGLDALTTMLEAQTTEATKLLGAGWIDRSPGLSVEYFMMDRDSMSGTNDSNSGDKPKESGQPEIRVNRLRMSGQGTSQHRPNSPNSSSPLDKDDELITFQLLHTILATVGKCSGLERNLIKLHELGATNSLISLLNLLPPYLMTFRQPSCAVSPLLRKVSLLERVCALNIHCLSLVAKLPEAQTKMASRSSTLNNLIDLLSHVSPDILVPTINAIASMATDTKLMQLLNKQNGFLYLFSLSFHADMRVRTAALWAVRAFLKTATNRGTLLRPVSSSVGNMVQALSTEYSALRSAAPKPAPGQEQLLSAICSVLAEIASDDQGRAILIELGVVPYLANLTAIAQEDCLKIGVSSAVTQFGTSDLMIKAFRDREVLNALIEFVRNGSPELKVCAAKALDVLSADHMICVTIRALDISSIFLKIMCDAPHELQSAAAHVIGRVARLRLMPTRKEVGHS